MSNQYVNFSPNEAYCFITLKCLGWEEDDDPWEEQKKRKKGHPLWRKFVPAANDYEIIRKPTVIFVQI